MEKNYNHSNERTLAEAWERAAPNAGYFNPDNLPGKRKEKFVISMPPPNATGILHLGHAVTIAFEDLMVRFHRMKGDDTLWLPGTDHAAIATNAKVERILANEGKGKQELGRKKFLRRVEAYVEDSKKTIRTQIRAMGASCDWSREQFTLSPELSRAVAKAFIDMYNAGLIYRGERVVNWCPHCGSTLADDEVEYRDEEATLYTFRYDEDFPFAIASTRPETKLGDTGVAVHPDDTRYKDYIGKTYRVHIGGVVRSVTVVADKGVDRAYGTGALGVTPAHSQTDEAIARREKLPSVKVIGEDGRMTGDAGSYAGLPAREARRKLIAELLRRGLVEKEETLTHNLSVCYRCGTPIEPLPSRQWFVAVDKPYAKDGKKHPSLKEQALSWVKSGRIAILPERFKKVYLHWMGDLHDWNISRQIWYGHAIPAWFKNGEVHVGESAPKGTGWEKDPDVLDTWFSSALWTFSTLGWPEETDDLKRFHPTTVMETGYDILFFWVARMILMSSFCLDDKPFEVVYLHGMLRDRKGRKMSKSLGNGIDPLEMSETYGADAVRLALTLGTTPGQDMQVYEEKIKGYRNFVNKLWNIARYSIPRIAERPTEKLRLTTMPEKAALARLHAVTKEATASIESFQFGHAGNVLYEFVWHEYADWYLEIEKLQPNPALLRESLVTILKLLHPFMPFVTEAIWQELPRAARDAEQLIVAPWPAATAETDRVAEGKFAQLTQTIAMLRRYKKYTGLPEHAPLPFTVASGDTESPEARIIRHLAKLEWKRKDGMEKGQTLAPTDIRGSVETAIDQSRLTKETRSLEKQLTRIDAQLQDETFVKRAPAHIVAELKEKRTQYQKDLKELQTLLS